jgi:UTP--glucose-1-phosphate uridylyltransferase
VNEVPAAAQLIEEFYRKNAPILALEKVSDERVSSYGIIESLLCTGRVHEVKKFLEKPKPEETTSRL